MGVATMEQNNGIDSRARVKANMTENALADFKALCGFKSRRLEEFAGEIISEYVQVELPRVFEEKGYVSNPR